MFNYCLIAAGLSLVAAVVVIGACMFSSRLSQDEEAEADVARNIQRIQRDYDDVLPALPIEASCRIGHPERVPSVREIHRN